MFGFLNRNKTQSSDGEQLLQGNVQSNGLVTNGGKPQLEAELNDARKNLYDSIVLKRIDIVVSLMNEWLKS